MTSRTWTDPSGRTWIVSRYPSPGALAIPLDLPVGNVPANSGYPWWIRFKDPEHPTNHASVPYTSEKPVSQLSDEEIAEYWEQVIADHPELDLRS